MVDIDRMEHSTGFGVGENLSWSAGRGDGDDQAVDAVNRWYGEIENYNFATGTSSNGKVIGHFTQVALILRISVLTTVTRPLTRWNNHLYYLGCLG